MYFRVGDTWFNRDLVLSAKATLNTGFWYATFRLSGTTSDLYFPTQYATQALAEAAVREFLLGE